MAKKRRSTYVPTEAEKQVTRAMYQGVIFGAVAFSLTQTVYIIITNQ